MNGRVLVVEDDAALRRELAGLLEVQGYEAVTCDGKGDAAFIAEQVFAAKADCVLLDLMLPETDGHAVCRSIRNASDVPIIMLTASDRELDEVLGLGLGADDYVTKPYSPASLVARIQAHMRRGEGSVSTEIEHEGVVLDIVSGRVSYMGSTLELTRNELRILTALMRTPGAVVSRAELMRELWESDEFIDDNTLTVNINRLRRKLENLGVSDGFITTRRNMGYSI